MKQQYAHAMSPSTLSGMYMNATYRPGNVCVSLVLAIKQNAVNSCNTNMCKECHKSHTCSVLRHAKKYVHATPEAFKHYGKHMNPCKNKPRVST